MAIRVLYTNKGIRIILPATYENVDRAAEEIKIYLEKIGVNSMVFHIVLGIREALTNAVKHGSLNDEEKRVFCELKKERKLLTIRVEDEGKGFEWKRYLFNKISSGVDSGRGIAIMRGCFKTMKYNKKGNRLILEIET